MFKKLGDLFSRESEGQKLAAAMYSQLQAGEPRASLRSQAVSAFLEHRDDNLLALIRDIDEKYSKSATYFRIEVHGKLSEQDPQSDEIAGFYTTADVVADSSEEAMGFVRSLVDEQFVTESLEAEEVEAIEPRPTEPKGVYSLPGFSMYATDDEDDSEEE